jgi:hypothetical protein
MKEIFTQRILATGNDSNSETLVHFQLIAIGVPGFGTLPHHGLEPHQEKKKLQNSSIEYI